jgi:dTDP-glucose 4,6-dehydratase
VRESIHVDDHCEAIDAILAKGGTGEIYNVGMGDGRRNLDVIRAIVRLTGRDDSLIHHIPDRPGHDRRYSLRTDKIRAALGWRPRRAFDDGLAATVEWYRANRAWTAWVGQGAHRPDDARHEAARASVGSRP